MSHTSKQHVLTTKKAKRKNTSLSVDFATLKNINLLAKRRGLPQKYFLKELFEDLVAQSKYKEESSA